MSKGDWRRPSFEEDAKVKESWCYVFGHKGSAHGEWCINCGKSLKDVVGEAVR